MPSTRELFEKYAAAVAYVAVERSDGGQHVGTAFHVGEGVFVTARHVVEGFKILEISTTIDWSRPGSSGLLALSRQDVEFTSFDSRKGTIRAGPYFHSDPSIDVAALLVDGIVAPTIPLGGHLDDWINDEAFILREVLIMGYPRVPLAKKNVLLATRAEVNAIIDPYTGKHPRFIVSSIARGGFSGGPCMIEWDFALGLVTNSLLIDDKPAELGFMSVITGEPILECLGQNRIMPKELSALWEGLFEPSSQSGSKLP